MIPANSPPYSIIITIIIIVIVPPLPNALTILHFTHGKTSRYLLNLCTLYSIPNTKNKQRRPPATRTTTENRSQRRNVHKTTTHVPTITAMTRSHNPRERQRQRIYLHWTYGANCARPVYSDSKPPTFGDNLIIIIYLFKTIFRTTLKYFTKFNDGVETTG